MEKLCRRYEKLVRVPHWGDSSLAAAPGKTCCLTHLEPVLQTSNYIRLFLTCYWARIKLARSATPVWQGSDMRLMACVEASVGCWQDQR